MPIKVYEVPKQIKVKVKPSFIIKMIKRELTVNIMTSGWGVDVWTTLISLKKKCHRARNAMKVGLNSGCLVNRSVNEISLDYPRESFI